MTEENKNPKVSICIPLYNRKEYIKEAIDSAVNQTFKDIEIIVLDDGSTDGGYEYVKSLNLPIRLYAQENQGAIKAYNRLIELAQGEYISILDSDDVLANDAIEQLLKALKNNNEYSVAYGNYIRIDSNGCILGKCNRILKSGVITEALFHDNIVHNVGTLVPKCIFEEFGGYTEKFSDGFDTYFYLRVSLKYKFICVEQPVFKRRRHDKNISAFSYKNVSEEINMLEDFYNKCNGKEAIGRKVAEKRLAKEYYRLGKASVLERRNNQRAHFLNAFLLNHSIKYLIHYLLGK